VEEHYVTLHGTTNLDELNSFNSWYGPDYDDYCERAHEISAHKRPEIN
jgi:hypothetical protein